MQGQINFLFIVHEKIPKDLNKCWIKYILRAQPYSLTSLQSLMIHGVIFKVQITAIKIKQKVILYCRTFSLPSPPFLI